MKLSDELDTYSEISQGIKYCFIKKTLLFFISLGMLFMNKRLDTERCTSLYCVRECVSLGAAGA